MSTTDQDYRGGVLTSNLSAELRASSNALEAHRLPYSAELVIRAADEIDRLTRELAMWLQVWDNVKLDNPNLREDNKPLAVAATYALLKVKAPQEATGLQPVRRWNAKYPGISMQEHNGDLIRSGFGPYVLAEDYDRLSRTLDAVEKARAIERKARQRLQTELLALCTQHVGGELDPDNANPAGNSHHE